jgi:esterase
LPELKRERVVAPGAEPAQWLYVLHGIYGAGRNWASVLRRVVRERPDWGALLIDLRQHGGSQGFAGPHTVAAAAADLAQLEAHGEPRPAAVMGHSFGGKVALVYGLDHGAGLRQLWVIDSTPEARPPTGSAWEMLEIVRRLPSRFGTRDELIGALERAGVQRGVAQWLATNLEADGEGGYRWRFDLDAMESLLRDFFRTDAWAAVESPPAGVEVHLVRARESSVLSGAALARARAAAEAGSVQIHEVDGGHWVNADNPDALVALLAERLPTV